MWTANQYKRSQRSLLSSTSNLELIRIRPRFYEEKNPSSIQKSRPGDPNDGTLEKKFLRSRDPNTGISNLVYSGGPGIELKNQRSPATSISSSQAPPKYTIPRGISTITQKCTTDLTNRQEGRIRVTRSMKS